MMRASDAREAGIELSKDKLYVSEVIDTDEWHPQTVASFEKLLDRDTEYPYTLMSPLTGRPMVVSEPTASAIASVVDVPSREKPIDFGGRPRKTGGVVTARHLARTLKQAVELLEHSNVAVPWNVRDVLDRAEISTFKNDKRLDLPQKNNTTGVTGVSMVKSTGKYRVYFRKKYLGVFDSYDDAVYARRQAERDSFEGDSMSSIADPALQHIKL
jgi:hypothetical protein